MALSSRLLARKTILHALNPSPATLVASGRQPGPSAAGVWFCAAPNRRLSSKEGDPRDPPNGRRPGFSLWPSWLGGGRRASRPNPQPAEPKHSPPTPKTEDERHRQQTAHKHQPAAGPAERRPEHGQRSSMSDRGSKNNQQQERDKRHQVGTRSRSSDKSSAGVGGGGGGGDDDDGVEGHGRSSLGGGGASGQRYSHQVQHDSAGHRFVLDLGNNQTARIDYRQIGLDKIDLYHTEVPRELRGSGIGKELARGALDCAEKSRLRIKLTCDYLKYYMQRYAEPRHKRLLLRNGAK